MKGIDNTEFQTEEIQINDLQDADNNNRYPLRLSLTSIDTLRNIGLERNGGKPLSPFQEQVERHRKTLNILLYVFLNVVVISYFSYATYRFIDSESEDRHEINPTNRRCYGNCGFQWCDGYGFLLLVLIFVYFGLFYYIIFKPRIGKRLHKSFISPAFNEFRVFLTRGNNQKITVAVILFIILSASVVFIYFQTQGSESRLFGLFGPIIFILCGYIFSTDRKSIKWRPVICGITLQFVLGIACIRWEVGRSIFKCFGEKVAIFLEFTNEGSKFVFGDELIGKQIFAFALLPVVFFFSFCISILYYYGAMQWLISKLGWILQEILGTTVCESVNSAGNIFLGMTESPLMIRPYIVLLTRSEIHAIMASGFATVSGTVLAAYISFGAQPSLLITSTVMAAPGALALAKLYHPESEESKTKSDNIKLEESKDSSVLDAASNGASIAIEIVLGIIANLVSFIAFIAFVNAIISWFGYLVGLDITFQWILSKIFIPISWCLGIPWEDCEVAADIISTKTIVNEFVAYKKLGDYAKAGCLQARSIVITTFAICGFANPSSVGISIGTLGVMAPSRRGDITGAAFRAFIVGCAVCFISASFAGLLITDSEIESIIPGASSSEGLTRENCTIA